MKKQNIHFILSIISFLFLHFASLPHAFAQRAVNTVVGDAVMPPPSVASLGKYTDIDVYYGTGTVDVSVPIYNLKTGPLSLPVTLSYHTSGVKANEISDWVGTGWNLSAGGMVSRTVQGIPDEWNSGYWTTHTAINSCGNTPPLPMSVFARATAAGIINKSLDGEPDLFSFNIPGYSGKFYFDIISSMRKAILVPEQDIIITEIIDAAKPEKEKIRGFKIITPDGTIYWFGEKDSETAIEISNASGTDATYVGWHLLKIESSDQKHAIHFDYQDDNFIYHSSGSLKKTVYYKTCPGTSPCPPISNNTSPVSGFPVFENRNNGKKLLKIYTTNESIDFIATADRDDTHLLGSSLGKKLNSIEIKSGDYCKKFSFTYDYFKSSPTATNANDKRLRLKSLQETSCDNPATTTVEPYTFEYNGDFMPNVLTRMIDHWGYYNGATVNQNNDLNIPPTTVTASGDVNGNPPLTMTIGSSNRETNETEMLKGSLKKVNYPTGGYTQYTFEANTYNAPAQRPNSSVTQKPIEIERSGCASQEESGLIVIDADDILPDFDLTITICDKDKPFPKTKHIVPAYAAIQLLDAETGLEIDRFEFDSVLNTFHTSGRIDQIFPKIETGKSYKVRIPSPEEICSEFSPLIRFSITASNATASKLYPAEKIGGLRIRRIESHDGLSTTNNIIREFEYSDGHLIATPKYFYTEGFSSISVIGGTSVCSLNVSVLCAPVNIYAVKYVDNSIVPLSTWDGYHVLYSNVYEYIGSVSDPLFTTWNEHEYFVPDPVTNNYDPNVYPPVQPQSLLLGGQFKSTTNWKAEEGIQSTEEVLQYTTGSKFSAHTFYIADWDVMQYGQTACSGYASTLGDHWQIRGYNIRTGNFKVKERKTTVNFVPSTTNYEYGSTSHHFPTATWSTNSDGKVFRTEYTYNTDYSDATLKTQLVNSNIISTPWKISNKVDGIEVDGSEIEYAFFSLTSGASQAGASGAHPRPNKFHRYERTWNSSGTLTGTGKQLVSTISNYDANGFPKTYTADGWLPETYEWTSDGLIKKRTFSNFVWNYTYLTNTRMLSTIQDKDGQTTNFEYDALSRLKKSKAKGDNIISEYTYNFKTVANPYNFVKTKTTYTATSGSSLNIVEDFQYFDGLGRPIQNVQVKASPAQKDIINTMVYDNRGRVTKEYVPFEANQTSGAYVATIPTGTTFTAIGYEGNGVSRTISVTPPGWYATTTAYYGNASTTDAVIKDLSSPSVFYADNTLFEQAVTDPNGNRHLQFTDFQGKLILSRRLSADGMQKADTYYQYDNKNRLTKVIPPGATLSETNSLFSYLYDGADNMLSQKVPGKDAEEMRYDGRDMMTFYQDAVMLGQSKWMMYKYNVYGQQTSSGFWNGTTPPATNNGTTPYSELLTENIYDDLTAIYKGRVKQTKVKILNGNATPNFLDNTFVYDTHGRISTITGNNHINLTAGSEIITFNSYDYAGNIIQKTRAHKKDASTTLTIRDRYTFDHRGRQLNYYHKINTGTEVLISNHVYNTRDFLTQKNLGGTTPGNYLQNIDYAYDAHGLLTSINGAQTATDLFYMSFQYAQPNSSVGSTIQKNNNISTLFWKVGTGNSQVYGFQYDFLDRMTKATYGEISGGTYINLNRYNEENIQYDARGNFTNLRRRGKLANSTFGVIDELSYTYESTNKNRVGGITEAASADLTKGFKTAVNTATYTYDSNGNLKRDNHKNMGLTYFFHNLPKKVTFDNGNTIDWVYDAYGSKLTKKTNAATNNTTHYVGGIEYAGTATSFSIQSIYHAEGRCTIPVSTWRYEYYIRDHLGNTRITFADLNANNAIATSEILQQNHYYPFGANIEGLSSTSTPDKYQYNGKEWNADFGLEWNDYGARWYDPWVSRWWNVDPMGEDPSQIGCSPYHYAYNNPMNFFDPDGLKGTNEYVYDSEKNTYAQVGNKGGNQTDYIYQGTIRYKENGDISQVAYSHVGEQIINVQSITTFDENLLGGRGELLRSPGVSDFHYGRAAGGINPVDNFDDPILSSLFSPFKGAAALSSRLGMMAEKEGMEVAAEMAAKTSSAFFEGASYSSKVLKQMGKADDIYHAFPKSVDGFATKFGQWSTKLGADGKPYQWLKMPGSYGGRTGVFEYTKDANGLINHRFFNVSKTP